jgi:FkbM family methyltransferase
MNKIFIDAGANDGCSVKKFRQIIDKNNQFMIYSFEVDPIFSACFDNIKNHMFINKAVWIKNGKQKFYRSSAILKDGGTLIKEKITGELDKKNPLLVDTLDFSKWIIENLSIEDYIILKMDIEGAEYKVISKMIKDGSFSYIDELYIEWHRSKIGITKKEHNELIEKIKIPMKKWCALNMSELKRKNDANKKI